MGFATYVSRFVILTLGKIIISIHEHRPPQTRRELKEVGWTKELELAKVARRDGQEFDCGLSPPPA